MYVHGHRDNIFYAIREISIKHSAAIVYVHGHRDNTFDAIREISIEHSAAFVYGHEHRENCSTHIPEIVTPAQRSVHIIKRNNKRSMRRPYFFLASAYARVMPARAAATPKPGMPALALGDAVGEVCGVGVWVSGAAVAVGVVLAEADGDSDTS